MPFLSMSCSITSSFSLTFIILPPIASDTILPRRRQIVKYLQKKFFVELTAFDRQSSLLARKAKIQGVRCSPHTLRHTFATNFIRNGGDVFTLQKILGHADIQTCMVYVHMSGKHVQEAMLRHSPVDKLTQQ
jgi:integrase